MKSKKLHLNSREKNHQARGFETRARILKTSSRCLEQDGIHALRFANIAKAAKIPQALMGYHFPDMDALLLELVQNELEKLRTRSVENVEKHSANPRKAFAAYIRAPFELASEDSSFRAVWTSFYHLSAIRSEFSDVNLRIRKTGRERIVNLITMLLVTEGHLHGQDNISRSVLLQQATAIQGVITGLAIMAMSESQADYLNLSDLAVTTCLKLLGINEK